MSYLKDTTDFINFIENTQISNDVVLATRHVTYLTTQTSLKQRVLTLFAIIMKSTTSIICQFPQTITEAFTAHTQRELFQI